jgi:dCTP diphosphatase
MFSPLVLDAFRAEIAAFAAEREWNRFHQPRNLLLALVGEVGELAELFQWRGDEGAQPGLPGWSARDAEHLGEEMSDVFIYLLRLADRCGVDLAAAASRKLELNRKKYPAALARGSSAKYTAYEGTKLVAADSGAGSGGSADGGGDGGGGGGDGVDHPPTTPRAAGDSPTARLESAAVRTLDFAGSERGPGKWLETACVAGVALAGGFLLARALRK